MKRNDYFLGILRNQFHPGDRIRLVEMKDPISPVEPGAMGTLEFIDDAGHMHVRWDNGRTLSLIPGEDRFSTVPQESTILKLYMPLTATLYERNEDGGLEEDGTSLKGRDLLGYEELILAEMVKARHPDEAERGLMCWYYKKNRMNEKVRSALFSVEAREGQLWGVAECRVLGTLLPEELEALKDHLAGQASDGWGEGFEQREIKVEDRGELYVHLWNSSDDWRIQTEQELFAPKLMDVLRGEGSDLKQMGGMALD